MRRRPALRESFGAFTAAALSTPTLSVVPHSYTCQRGGISEGGSKARADALPARPEIQPKIPDIPDIPPEIPPEIPEIPPEIAPSSHSIFASAGLSPDGIPAAASSVAPAV